MNQPSGLLASFAAALVVLVPAVLARTSLGGQRGAAIAWTVYEAEEATTSGQVLGPDFTGNTPAREASGRRCVRIAATGQFLEFTAKADANALVVRYSIPDTSDGVGADATLSLYINGKLAQKLPLTSKYSHLFGAYPFKNDPSAGSPRNFWDELRLMPVAVHAGDVIRLEKGAGDTAAEYLIDLVDLEQVPPPIDEPADALSITDFGATANDRSDDRPAILAAIAAAKAQHKTVWIPPGTFIIKGAVEVADVTIRGAGMWHSTLVGVDDYTPENRVAINGAGSNITLSDFAILGKLNYRNDAEPNDGIGGSFGEHSIIRNVWIEHTKTGAWITNSDGLLVEGCRFRNTIADGINLCLGMRNCIVRDCTARGTGDDCFAMWPATYARSTYTHGGNRFARCTAQTPFLAQAFAIYGGESNGVEDCEASDIPYGAGLYASTTFPSEFGFRGTTTFRNVNIVRAGDADGAIGTVANLIDLTGVRFEEIDVIDSPKDAIRFTSMKEHALRDATFDRIRIDGAEHAIAEAPGAVGSATISNVIVLRTRSAAHKDDAPKFNLIRGAGNQGLNDERGGSYAKEK